MNNRHFLLLISGLLLCSLFVYPLPQDVDSFYLRTMEKAEKAFLSGDYLQAAKDFEVAAFGLAGDARLRAKALVYLGLTRFYLNDMKACEKNMREAAGLLKAEDWSSLEIAAQAKPDLDRLLGYFGLSASGQEGSPPQPGTPQKTDAEVRPASEEKPSAKDSPSDEPATKLNVDMVKEGDLVPLDLVESPPEVVKKVEAAYPAWARSSGLEPTVIVNALISENGKVTKTRIIGGAKNAAGFNQAAEQAVRLWKFRPATIKGLRVKVWLPVSVQFKAGSTD